MLCNVKGVFRNAGLGGEGDRKPLRQILYQWVQVPRSSPGGRKSVLSPHLAEIQRGWVTTIGEPLKEFLPLLLGLWSSLASAMAVCPPFGTYMWSTRVRRAGNVPCKLSEDVGSAGPHSWRRAGI